MILCICDIDGKTYAILGELSAPLARVCACAHVCAHMDYADKKEERIKASVWNIRWQLR